MKYRATISGATYYKTFSTDAQSIDGFKREAYRRNGKLTDIQVQMKNKKWSRIIWR